MSLKSGNLPTGQSATILIKTNEIDCYTQERSEDGGEGGGIRTIIHTLGFNKGDRIGINFLDILSDHKHGMPLENLAF